MLSVPILMQTEGKTACPSFWNLWGQVPSPYFAPLTFKRIIMKNYVKKALFSGLLLGLSVSAPNSYADGSTGFRDIGSVGCLKNATSTCFVTLLGAALPANPPCDGTNPSNLSNANQIRWDSNDVNGKNTLALVSMAKATNKRMQFSLLGCYDTRFPAFSSFVIE